MRVASREALTAVGPVAGTGSLGAVPLVVFRLDRQRYALRLATVERVLPMAAVSPLPQAPAVALGVINIHGRIVPVLDPRRRFELPARDYGPTAHLVLARTSRREVALPVDEVLEVAEVAVETVASPESVLPELGYIGGVVALEDGLLLIHDLDTFLSLDEELVLADALEEARP